MKKATKRSVNLTTKKKHKAKEKKVEKGSNVVRIRLPHPNEYTKKLSPNVIDRLQPIMDQVVGELKDHFNAPDEGWPLDFNYYKDHIFDTLLGGSASSFISSYILQKLPNTSLAYRENSFGMSGYYIQKQGEPYAPKKRKIKTSYKFEYIGAGEARPSRGTSSRNSLQKGRKKQKARQEKRI